ncbi:MlaC/ttg2D family ABC transporter substrate-binding protein [Amphibiibacter pelophylacis]|uniref:ABC transporter substrate-binding protein n=1 Tax=Amphibiibacter pelophylacis TaxID=1799477 RepID=A0ACC6P4V4_9BURK
MTDTLRHRTFASRRLLAPAAAVVLSLTAVAWSAPALAQQATAAAPAAADTQQGGAVGFVKKLSDDLLAALKADPAALGGNVSKIRTIVDTQVMPNVDFARMTATSVGRPWREATPDQKRKLQDEFKTLLINTYSGAAKEFASRKVQFLPVRGDANADQVVVRSQFIGSGQPLPVDYRVEKLNGNWRVYDVSVSGLWLVDQYRNDFAQTMKNGGVDALLAKLSAQNKAAAQ